VKNYLSTLKLILLLLIVVGARVCADGYDRIKGPTQTRTIRNHMNTEIMVFEIWQGNREGRPITVKPGGAIELEIPINDSQIEVLFCDSLNLDIQRKATRSVATKPFPLAVSYLDCFVSDRADAPAERRDYLVSGNPWWTESKPKITWKDTKNQEGPSSGKQNEELSAHT